MSTRLLLTEGLDGFIRLSVGKGCYLKLSTAAYYQAIADGKAEARARTQAAREQRAQVQREADTLAWIDEVTL